MERYYRFAGIDIALQMEDDRFFQRELHLEPFRVEQVTNPHIYRVQVAESLPMPTGAILVNPADFLIESTDGGYIRYIGPVSQGPQGAYARVEHRGNMHDVRIRADHAPERVSVKLMLNSLDVEHLVADSGGVILHASMIEWQGRAILFTAPSGTGKSTQAELWKEYRGARIINGDRAVVLERDGVLCAAGLPFCGSSRYCEPDVLPLAAVVYLKQAPKTTIRRLRGMESFFRLWEGSCLNQWNREETRKVTALLEKMAGSAEIYELPCTPDESAVTALEQQLRKQV